MDFDETWQEASPQHPLSSLCFSCRSEIQDGRPGLWLAETFFDFFSTTAIWVLTKLDRKQVLNALYQVCVFRADRKSKMAALASDWLNHFSASSPQPLNGFWRNLTGSKSSTPSIKFVFFGTIGNPRWPPWPLIGWNIFRLLLRNRWMDFDETWQEARYQRPLPSLCFLGRSGKQDGRPGLWLAETFSTSPLKPLNWIQRNLTGSKTSTSSTKFVFFGPIGKTSWPPWPLIGWDIFDFSSETAERNWTKIDRKQDLNVLYQVCVFRADWKNKMPPWPIRQKGGTLYSRARYVALWASCFFRAPAL